MTQAACNTVHHTEHWSAHTNGQGKVQLELTDPQGQHTRLTLKVADALALMEAIGRACKKARAEGQEG